MKRNYFIPPLLGLLALNSDPGSKHALPATVIMSKATLQDKIKGGWAGQLIGCTFGGPTEFKFNGTMINDYQPIPWYDGYIKKTMVESPGLYDDLTFVDIFEKKGSTLPSAITRMPLRRPITCFGTPIRWDAITSLAA